ncbi:MAG TPA: PKD domain-containing protein [Symbiobacteriaceae bacterium]|nr:PKD domain-containing protein [Symbiobacteriaceae bacterium]
MKKSNSFAAAFLAVVLTASLGAPALAANPASGTTSTGQTLSIEITGPADGSRVNVPPGTVNATGTVSIGPLSDSGNVMYVVDVSGSTQVPQNQDCNGDGAVNSGDDVNGDGVRGTTLDCEVAGVVALNASLAGAPGAEAGLILFGSSAAIADVGPAAGEQSFASPLTLDANANGQADIDDVAKSLRYTGQALQFTAKSVGTGTNFDAALSSLAAAFASRAGENNIAFFLSDGQANLNTAAGSPLSQVVAAGIKVNTYSVGTSSTGCGTTANLRRIADATGGICTVVTDPSTLSTVLVTPATISKVEVSLNGGAMMMANLMGNAWDIPLSGLTGGIWNTIAATVTASDGSTATAMVQVYGNQAPAANAGGPYMVAEGSPLTLGGSASDPDGDAVTIAWAPSTHLSAANTATPTFQADDNMVENLTMSVSDPYGMSASSSTTVTVMNVAPTAKLQSPSTVDEGASFAISLYDQYDPSMADTAAGFQYAFACDGGAYVPAAGPTASCMYDDGPGSHTVMARIMDKDGGMSEYSATVQVVNVAPTADLQVPAMVNEGDSFAVALANEHDASMADTAAGFTKSFDCGAGFSGVASCTAIDNPSMLVKGRIMDKDGGMSEYSATVPVMNVAPSVGAIMAPLDPNAVGSTVSTTANFTDPGILDTHTAVWQWGDGSSSAGTVAEVSGSGMVGGSHIYTMPGIYTVTLTVTDKDGGVGTSVFQYVVVYDPNGGFVTGGGWINSPAGAYTPDPTMTGRANFGFVAKYHKGQTVPDGQTQFQFKAGNLNFHSTAYEWLVVAGARAQYKGSGTIGGAGDYGFMLTAIDGQQPGGGGSDKFRIKIWDKASGTVIYDNQMGGSDDAEPTTVLAGGSIVIHK